MKIIVLRKAGAVEILVMLVCMVSYDAFIVVGTQIHDANMLYRILIGAPGPSKEGTTNGLTPLKVSL